MPLSIRRLGILACGLLVTSACFAQSAASSEDSGRFGIGVKGSLLGGGVEAAARVTERTNLRAGFNMLSFSRRFNKDGVAYSGQLRLKSVEAHYDIFPFAGSFHVSPGVLFNVGTPITATANVAGGQSFSLGGTTYYSDVNVPVRGSGNIKFNQAAPMATVGWGNLIPRRAAQHFSFPFEIGVAFQGSPKATLGLAGSLCDQPPSPAANCRGVASDPTVQANIMSEQTKLNHSMSLFKAFPIISVGISYKF